jgi:putative transposase
MPRAARIVVPDAPHHVIQRGNRQQPLFFSSADRRRYLRLLADACERHAVSCVAWCLMDNHIHLILIPPTSDALRAVMASVQTSYSQAINREQKLSGHLFQGRFKSIPLESAHYLVAVRYIENNPVAAGVVDEATSWPWSSARAHVAGVSEGLTDLSHLAEHIPNWRAMLQAGLEAAEVGDSPLAGTVPSRD